MPSVESRRYSPCVSVEFERRGRMGFFKFSCVLNRKITEEEFATLQEAGCAGGMLSTYVLPVSDNTVVTQIDFDKAEAETLYDAMKTVLDALTKVPKLSAFSLDVPEEPAGQAPGTAEGSQIEPEPISDASTPVTAQVETAADDVAKVEADAEQVEALADGAASADGTTGIGATANGIAEADLKSANDNGAANGTRFTADDAAAAVEPVFAESYMV